jgi:chromate reductase
MNNESSEPLNYLVFLGSVRQSTPPKPARLGMRVAQACMRTLRDETTVPQLVDPLSDELRGSLEVVFKPHFSYARNQAPAALEQLAQQIEAADGYVMVSPEYNHAMSPALANLLNHFGSSLFAYKPSAIVTYSAGQWGGARAAVNMRTFLSELGCLPVSAMVHIPKAQDVFADDGQLQPQVQAQAWQGYFDRTWQQLRWWAAAARSQRQLACLPQPQAFTRDPSQRNAPGLID